MLKRFVVIGALAMLGGCSEESDGTNLTPYLAIAPAKTASSGPASANHPATRGEKDTPMFRSIEDNLIVSPQISLADVAAAKAQGVTVIVNNRPDGEDPSAPQSADIAAAAKAAGIAYIFIPVTHAGFSRPQIDAMQAALDQAQGGKLLAFCRSGTRSTLLWALSQAAKGESPRVIAAKAADAGYDVAPISMMLDTLSGAAKAGQN